MLHFLIMLLTTFCFTMMCGLRHWKEKVLVIHPFVDTIKKQYEKRDKLFENSKLPTFESLECVRAIQSNAGENEAIEFSSYFDALESMKAEILKKIFR